MTGYLIILIYGSAMICAGLYIHSHCHAETQSKEIALSFDDGPHEEITPKVLNILEKYNIEAAFFVIGSKIKTKKDLINSISSKNHIIGNHSFSHSNLTGIFGKKKIIREIINCDNAINEVISKIPRFYRPPFGVTNPKIAKAIKKTNKVSIGWSIRSMDTTNRSTTTICNKVFKNLQSGSIILFHDNHSRIPEILEKVILHATSNGYTFKRLDKLINITPYE